MLESLKKDKYVNKLIKDLGSIPNSRGPEETKIFVKNQNETFKTVVAKIKK
ncbi:MAG: hypothetical protein JXQ99_02295 [Hyphomicrobiaceae bacterium]